MNRDKIKIIEFGMDEDTRPSEVSNDPESMKIVEFGKDREDSRPKVATGKDVRDIKIVEFDNDRSKAAPTISQQPKASVRPVKIVEFDENGEATSNKSGKPGMKILEFD